MRQDGLAKAKQFLKQAIENPKPPEYIPHQQVRGVRSAK